MTWRAATLVLMGCAGLAGLWWYERRRPSAKLVSLVATLVALAVAARVLFAAVPNVQGTTDVALLSGYVLGPAPGFVVGALAALASNVFLGQGPWTPWQMVGWGATGVAGAALAAVSRRRAGRLTLAAVCGLAGLLFGAWMDLFTLVAFTARPSGAGYLAIAGISLPFNLAHAIGNAALALAFGPAFVRVLERFRRRLDVRWEEGPPPVPAPGTGRQRPLRGGVAAACVAALALALALAAAGTAAAADRSVPRAVRYLERAQNSDGGFGAAPGQGSSQLITGWTMLGLEAAGRHPLDVTSAGRTPIDFMRSRAGELNDTGELERTILALRGAGLGVRRFAGRDLEAELLRRRRADGSFAGLPNWTAFGIMALRAAGRPAHSGVISKSSAWLARQQSSDGGFSLSGSGPGFVDETGAVLQGLAAAGKGRGQVVRAAIKWLRSVQNADGGFGQAKGHDSNSQSTAWAVQGIVAAGVAPSSVRRASRSPLAYLSSLQQADGSFRYSRSSPQTPVWVTAQVVAALRRKPFPVRAPARRRTATAAAATPAAQTRRRPAAPTRRKKRSERRATEEASAPLPTRRVATRAPQAAAAAPEPSGDSGLGVLPVAGLAAVLGGAAMLVWWRRRRA